MIQLAYRRGHSAKTAVLKVFSNIVDAIDKGNLALLALLNLSAAFDTVEHRLTSVAVKVIWHRRGPTSVDNILHYRTVSDRSLG